MNDNNKNQPVKEVKKRKCCSCYQKLPKKEMIINQGTYRCQPCYNKYWWTTSIFNILLWMLLLGCIFKFLRSKRKKKKVFYRSNDASFRVEVESEDDEDDE